MKDGNAKEHDRRELPGESVLGVFDERIGRQVWCAFRIASSGLLKTTG